MPCWNSLCLGFAPALICRIHIAGLLLKGASNSIRMCVLIQGEVWNYSGVADSETLQTGLLNRTFGIIQSKLLSELGYGQHQIKFLGPLVGLGNLQGCPWILWKLHNFTKLGLGLHRYYIAATLLLQKHLYLQPESPKSPPVAASLYFAISHH